MNKTSVVKNDFESMQNFRRTDLNKSREVYVGNLPISYNEEDVVAVFSDFKVQLRRLCRKDQKLFCFLACQDKNEVIKIVRKMNNTIVNGRNLVVRAQDETLQSQLEHNDVPHNGKHDAVTKSTGDVEIWDTSDEPPPLEPITLPSKKNICDGPQCCASTYTDETLQRPRIQSGQTPRCTPALKTLWVTNFPYGTTADDIFYLFKDYHPVQVKMICNIPTPNGFTEAFVTMKSKDIAETALLNLDNTQYKKRTLVIDFADNCDGTEELTYFTKKKLHL